MRQHKTAETLEALLRPVVEDLGFELVDLQLRSEAGRFVLRVLADRPGGITLDQCAALSREIGPHLEVEDPLAGSYVLEVSSPGIQRPLKRAADFDRFRGERVLIRSAELIDARKTFRGINQGIDGAGRVVVLDSESGREVAIPITSLREARLDPEIKF